MVSLETRSFERCQGAAESEEPVEQTQDGRCDIPARISQVSLVAKERDRLTTSGADHDGKKG